MKATIKIKCDMLPLPRRAIGICVIRHLAIKIRFFRGLEDEDNPCLACPQIIEYLEGFDMSSNRRGTCPGCGREDQYLFAKGKCRKCYFVGEGKEMPGWGTAGKDKKNPARKGEEKKIERAHPVLKCLICGKNPVESFGMCKPCKLEITNDGSVPSGEAYPECNHEVGVSLLAGILNKKIHDKEEFFHDGPAEKAIEINNFCPKCGERLVVGFQTVPIRFHTIVTVVK